MEQIDDSCHQNLFRRIPKATNLAPSALHQTIVSLQRALEEANYEISTLKKQINIKSEILEGKNYHHNQPNIEEHLNEIINKNQNNINQKKIINDHDNFHRSTEFVNKHIQTSIKNANFSLKNKKKIESDIEHQHCIKQSNELYSCEQPIKANIELYSSDRKNSTMASKIDVKIKLTSNVRIDRAESSSDHTADSTSGKLKLTF